MRNQYKILTGKDSLDIFNAALQYQYYPSEENRNHLDKLQAENTKRLNEIQIRNEEIFLAEYGTELLSFVRCISKPYFLIGKSMPFVLSWSVDSDSENDDYWSIRFYKGSFDYIKEICGGYAGEDVLEGNITTERVEELLLKSVVQ